MPASEPTYRLVVFDLIDDPAPVRELLARVAGVHPTDANQWLARLPGLWPRPLDEAQARELLDGLYELGVAAEARRTDPMPTLAPARVVHVPACLESGFRVGGLRGEPAHWVPWDKVELIDAGRVEQPDELRTIAPPTWVVAVRNGLNALLRRPQMIARRERSMRIAREPVGEIILVRRDPRIAFRLAETALNYAYLGDRLRPSASENFPILLDDLCAHATSAWLTSSTRALRAGGPADAARFPSSQALLDDATLQLLWSWYRRDREDDLRRRRDG
jgi:hypothetical protein